MVQDQQQGAPGKPFFLYFALGAMHAPHHVAPEWVDPYRGLFDKGWDAWRAELFARQCASGMVPDGTVLTERPEWVQAWDELSSEERRMLARQQEVFAGFLTHTDAQIGRVLSSLENLGALDNTIVMVFSDNGASAEGGKAGSFNEHRFTAHIRESMDENLAHYDDWGGFTTYNHYSWAWAWAGNTPHKLWKRYTWLGGTRTPLIVHWPGRIARPGAMRPQFAHVIDLMPTIMAAAGLDIPDEVDGVAQQPVDGVSLLSALEDPATPELHPTQYFEMMGSRSIYHEGWKATTNHISSGILDEEELAVGSRNFDDDRWELFDLSVDFSEATDRADEEPERLQRLRDLWDAEAQRNNVLPISDGLVDRFGGFIPPIWPRRQRTDVPSRRWSRCRRVGPDAVGRLRHHSRHRCRRDGAGGVVFALGDWFGGYALYLVGGRAHFTFARAADTLELAMPSGLGAGPHTITVSYAVGEGGAAGRMVLLVDGGEVDETSVEGMLPLAVQHGGAGLRLGWDSGFPVSARYAPPARFSGTVHEVRVDTPGARGPTRRRGARRAPRRLIGRGGLPWPQSSCGTPASMLSSPRLHDPGAAPSAAARDGQALQQRVHGRRHPVQGTFERDLPVEEVGLDRPRAAGQALPARSSLPLPRGRGRNLDEVAAALPILLGAGDGDARRGQRLLALALRLPRQRAEPALGAGQCLHRVGEVHEELAVLPAHDVGAGHGLEGGSSRWRRRSPGRARRRPKGIVRYRGAPTPVPSAAARHRAAAGKPGTSRRCHRCSESGAGRGARSPRRSAGRPPVPPTAPRRVARARGRCSDPSRPAAPPGRRRRQPPRTPPPAPPRREWAG